MSEEPTQKEAGRPALRGGTASEHIHLRAVGKRKSHYVRHAKEKGLSLAAWMFEVLDAASGYQETSLPTPE